MERLPEPKETPLVLLDDRPLQLPPGGNKMERIAGHTRGLVEDITSWVDLRVRLVQAEVEEKVAAQINKLVLGALLALMALLVLVFALVTLALALGAWLGHAAWGFLIVTGLLVVTTGIVAVVKPAVLKGRS